MTLDEIIAAEIPAGPYSAALRMMQGEAELIRETLAEGNDTSYTPVMIASWGEAFAVLMTLANGGVLTTHAHANALCAESFNRGREQALDEVKLKLQAVVSELSAKGFLQEADGCAEAIKRIEQMKAEP